MHEGMTVTHEPMASVDETRANSPGLTGDERADLLTRAAQHRLQADTDRGQAAEDRREAAIDQDGADDGARARNAAGDRSPGPPP